MIRIKTIAGAKTVYTVYSLGLWNTLVKDTDGKVVKDLYGVTSTLLDAGNMHLQICQQVSGEKL